MIGLGSAIRWQWQVQRQTCDGRITDVPLLLKTIAWSRLAGAPGRFLCDRFSGFRQVALGRP